MGMGHRNCRVTKGKDYKIIAPYVPELVTKEKWCFVCLEVKPVTEYYINRRHARNIESMCKLCSHKYRESKKNKAKEARDAKESHDSTTKPKGN